MEDICKKVGSKLRGLRSEKEYSREYVANCLSLNRETIARYERDAKNIDMDNFIKLLNLYEIDATIFFEQIYGKMPYKTNSEEE